MFVGRAPLWGVAVDGERGAALALSILGAELDRVMAFMGCATLAELDRSRLVANGESRELNQPMNSQEEVM